MRGFLKMVVDDLLEFTNGPMLGEDQIHDTHAELNDFIGWRSGIV